MSSHLHLSQTESAYCRKIASKIGDLRAFIDEDVLSLPPDLDNLDAWHRFLSKLRSIQGNLHNDASFIASLLAKRFIWVKHGVTIDAAAKPQGAPGLDIDVTCNNIRIVGEIKTTAPCNNARFGANQACNIKKDLKRLAEEDAKFRYMFVTDPAAFHALKRDYFRDFINTSIVVVLLPPNQESCHLYFLGDSHHETAGSTR